MPTALEHHTAVFVAMEHAPLSWHCPYRNILTPSGNLPPRRCCRHCPCPPVGSNNSTFSGFVNTQVCGVTNWDWTLNDCQAIRQETVVMQGPVLRRHRLLVVWEMIRNNRKKKYDVCASVSVLSSFNFCLNCRCFYAQDPYCWMWVWL